MVAAGGVPNVDPRVTRGALTRAFVALMRTKQGRWLGINVAAKVDPWLLRVTRGRGVATMFPNVNLTTIGAKSGKPRTTTLLYFTDGEDVILVASSFGRDKHPAWYHNLKANPEATLETAGGSGRYVAAEVEDEGERARLFGLVDQLYPGYADYRERAGAVGRRIPIMRLSAARS